MAVRQRGRKWQADFMIDRRRYRAEFETAEEALDWERDARQRVRLSLPVEAASKPTAGPAPSTIGGLVAYAAKNRWAGKKSGETLTRNAEHFRDFVGPNLPVREALMQEKIDAYCRELENLGRSGATVNRRLSAISVLLKLAQQPAFGGITVRPILHWQKESVGRLVFFSRSDFNRIETTLRHWGYPQYADYYSFLVDTGARLGEALKLKWEDVDIAGRKVTFVNRKSGRTTTMRMTERAAEAVLAQSLRGVEGGPWQWMNPDAQKGLWEKLRAHCGLHPEAVPNHTFRHTTASWLVQSGVDLFRVKEFMDHASIQTTMRYAHLAPKHMDEVVGVLEGH